MQNYLELLKEILDSGEEKSDRTGVGTIGLFGKQLRFNLQDGFPAVTTKKLAWKGVVSELLWFLEGSDDERRLAEIRFNDSRENLTDQGKFSTIWTDNADNQGVSLGYANSETEKRLGPIYGVQWRNFNGEDQVLNLIKGLKEDPNGRRHIISAWNPPEIKNMSLPACHAFSQFFISNNKLSCQLYQRSCDMFLGVPFNIASYSLLTHMLARECKLEVGTFIHSLGDFHIYKEHFEQVKIQLERVPKKLPELQFETKDFFKYNVNDFKLINYQHHEKIDALMNV